MSGRTISTSFIAGAGLKKWMPHTRSGRLVATASSTTGSVEVLVARMASGLTICSSSANRCFFDGEVLDDALDHEIAVGEVAEVVGGGDPREDRVALGLGVELAALDLLGERLGERRRPRRRRSAGDRERTMTS